MTVSFGNVARFRVQWGEEVIVGTVDRASADERLRFTAAATRCKGNAKDGPDFVALGSLSLEDIADHLLDINVDVNGETLPDDRSRRLAWLVMLPDAITGAAHAARMGTRPDAPLPSDDEGGDEGSEGDPGN